MISERRICQCVYDLNEYVLGSVLANLPNLTALHVVGCTKIDHHSVLSQTSHIPLLESLSVTSWVGFLFADIRHKFI